MNVVIELPLTEFDTLALKCDAVHTASDILNSAVMLRRPKKDHFERTMRITCDFEAARTLLALARQLHPHIVPIIEKSIRIAHAK